VKAGVVTRRPVLVPSHNYAAATGEYVRPASPPAPIWGEVLQIGRFLFAWKLTEGECGKALEPYGTARTREGAFRNASRAAQRPGLGRQAGAR
jgi:hypothetical protein